MIVGPSFLLILVILPTITHQELKYAREQTTINWEECEEYAACYCYDGTNIFPETQVQKPQDGHTPDEVGKCDIGIKSRFFTEESVLFEMIIVEDEIVVEDNAKLVLHIGGQEMFGCEVKINGNSKEIKLIGNADLMKNHKAGILEDRSSLLAKEFLCAFRVSRTPILDKMIQGKPYSQSPPSIKLITSKPKEYKFRSDAPNMFDRKSQKSFKCDPYSFHDLSLHSSFHVLPVLTRAELTHSCSSYPASYTMRYKYQQEDDKDMKELRCEVDKEDTTKFAYYVYTKDDGSDGVKVEDPDAYTFFCAARFDELCTKPVCNEPDCPKYHQGGLGDPATLSCIGRKWRVRNEYLVLDEDAKCEINPDTSNEFAFFLYDASGNKESVAKSDPRCFTDFDCDKKSHIHFDELIDHKADVVKCKDPTAQMKIFFYEQNATLIARNFTCEKSTGKWKNTTGGIMEGEIPAGSRVSCKEDEYVPETVVAAGTPNAVKYGIVAACLVAVVVLTCIASQLYTRAYAKRKYKPMSKAKFRKMEKAARVQYCKESFQNYLTTTPNSAHHIYHGLVEMDMLLALEIEDPECWEPVYSFLMRLNGTIIVTDYQICSMYTRYLYLKAKKIIDKHGWISPTPIRKSTPAGLIRVVALKLLNFALGNRSSPESEQLIVSGFRKLGFNGDTQYPHCGLLWSLIGHARSPTLKNKKDPNKTSRFDNWAYYRQLEEIASKSTMTIPEDEVIPAFGTVSQQAAFAFGAMHNRTLLTYDCRQFANNKHVEGGTISTTYFHGIGFSVTRSPVESCYLIFAQVNANPEVLSKLYKVAPENEWNKVVEAVLFLLVCYGRNHDATKFEQRFMTNMKQPSALLSRLQWQQRQFVEALRQQLEELRTWYAANTDKDELKQKIEYLFPAKFKQDNCKVTSDGNDLGDNPCSDPKTEASGPASEIETKSSAAAPDAEGQSNPGIKSAGSSGSSDSKEKDAQQAVPDAAPAAPKQAAATPDPAAPPSA